MSVTQSSYSGISPESPCGTARRAGGTIAHDRPPNPIIR
ncbi:hypothetical protein NSU_1347 [Novosphingobium pentaromativorans US6-1]|uniref:Uncharacterized protein n=1 Tax=Novosphingobium pentaromativorans US6-1 TaxID=1088721 RepID=G6EAE9_9SPHN|nr:hypothetical protein NSU_1347 [Novosphingobium pentaromativorans US6-1]